MGRIQMALVHVRTQTKENPGMSSLASEAGIAQGQEIVPEDLFLPRGQAKRRPAGQVNHRKLAQTGFVGEDAIFLA